MDTVSAIEHSQERLVTFEQAENLRKLFFDWQTTFGCSKKTNGQYETRNGFLEGWDGFSGWISRPTVPFALEWMRDVKGLHSEFTCSGDFGSWGFGVMLKGQITPIYASPTNEGFHNNKAAESKALDLCISLLLEQKERYSDLASRIGNFLEMCAVKPDLSTKKQFPFLSAENLQQCADELYNLEKPMECKSEWDIAFIQFNTLDEEEWKEEHKEIMSEINSIINSPLQ